MFRAIRKDGQGEVKGWLFVYDNDPKEIIYYILTGAGIGMYRNDLEALWPKTGELLRRSICLNIPVLMDDATVEKLTEAILSAAEAMG